MTAPFYMIRIGSIDTSGLKGQFALGLLLGALLWTGYLGGAIATHVRVGNPMLSHTLFPIYIAVMLWGSLWLRDRRVRGLLAG